MKSTGILKCFNVIAMLENVISRHSQTGKLLLKTSKPHEEQLKRNYLELDDVTQKLILQWMQKVGERSTHEGSITHDIVNLVSSIIRSGFIFKMLYKALLKGLL